MRVFTTNKRLRDRLDNYANLLWTADAKLKDLTAENDKLKAENDKLKTENSTLQSASAKKINNLQKVIKQKQEKIENQRDNLSILLDFYLNSENALSVKRKIAGLRHRIEFLESESGLKTRSVEGENDDWNIAQCPQITALETENASLKERFRWIPVTERLPEDGQDVFSFYSGRISLTTYEEEAWWLDDNDASVECRGFRADNDFLYAEGRDFPTHWMELPPPPEVKE